jgi:formylglycine-generating enzyme required for sulfatase activity
MVELQAEGVRPSVPQRVVDLGNGVEMKFNFISPGTFLMGTPEEEEEREDDENRHRVHLSRGYFMGLSPVTQEQWLAVMGNNPSELQGESHLPVEMISWDDCQAFIEKLRQIDSNPYRLPTEAELENACRAGTTTPFYFGETLSIEQANCNGDVPYGSGQKGANRKKSTPVGMFPPNGWGLFDMHGNVMEWCQDWLGDYPQGDDTDPQGPEEGRYRVFRGGSWTFYPLLSRSGFRSWVDPLNRYNNLGFRLVFSFDK